MILVGLTGGIGSGKSTVSTMLAARGAVIIDADAITRDVQSPGSPVVMAIAEKFGEQVLDADQGLRRAKLAEIVFTDTDALRTLNAIVHPAVSAEINRRVLALAPSDKIVVLDVPLLTENARYELQGKIVVDVPSGVAGRSIGSLPRFHREGRPGPDGSSGQPRGSVERRRLRDRQRRTRRRPRSAVVGVMGLACHAAAAPRRLQARSFGLTGVA